MEKKTFSKYLKINRITLKPVLYSWFISFTVILFSCDNDEDANFNINDEKVNVIIEQALYDSFAVDRSSNNGSQKDSDPYFIKSAKIEGVRLEIDVSYSGGCEEHTFDLFWPEFANQIYPPKLEVYLSHNANGDLCEAAINETLSIDLSAGKLNYTNQIIGLLEIIVVNTFDETNQVSTAD